MAAKAQHTPGPWKRGSCDSYIILARCYRSTDWIEGSPGDQAVCVCSVDAPMFTKGPSDPVIREAWRAEAQANADLIAAAPELLALAQSLVAPFADLDTDYLMEIGQDDKGGLHIVAGRSLTAHVALAIVNARAAIDKAEGV